MATTGTNIGWGDDDDECFPKFQKKNNGNTVATIVIFVLENVCLLICTILGNATMLANDRTLEQRKHGGFS